MGGTYRFLATVEESSLVVDWFRALADPPIENSSSDGLIFYFHNLGHLQSQHDSPLVSLFLPRRARGVLTSIGEIHFLPTPITQFPPLNRIAKQFRDWLFQFTRVYSHRPDFVHEWDYYLEGTAQNWDSDIYALPGGLQALRCGEYFVAHHDLSNSRTLDLVCRALDLRGVEGIQPT